ncbi:MAG: hypothetical protein AAFO96_29020, partial [Bacteroidota bacterium]
EVDIALFPTRSQNPTQYNRWNRWTLTVEAGQRPPDQKGFVPQKGRWQVERSFGWLNNCKRPFLASMIFDCNCRFWLMLGFVCPFMW